MTRRIRYDAWSSAAAWDAGVPRGTRVIAHQLVLATPPSSSAESNGDVECGSWTSRPVAPEFRLTELVVSWSARTPPGSWIEISVGDGRPDHPTGDDHLLAVWSSGEQPERRSSDTAGRDPETDVDLWRPAGGADGYHLVVQLFREPGTVGPRVLAVGAVASAGAPSTTTSRPGRTVGAVLDVPRLSQMDWSDVGGRGWCSPTAVSMVLAHLGRLPPATDIPAAAREVFDPAYDGTGNWSFNAAWAASVAGHAFVTRLHDLREVEAFIAAGIPLVASVAYDAGALPGAPTHVTDGHLVVIRGFTHRGDVVTNDPAAPTERSVRRTYDRAAFERAWLGGSGGTVYVIHDDAHPLPPPGARGAW